MHFTSDNYIAILLFILGTVIPAVGCLVWFVLRYQLNDLINVKLQQTKTSTDAEAEQLSAQLVIALSKITNLEKRVDYLHNQTQSWRATQSGLLATQVGKTDSVEGRLRSVEKDISRLEATLRLSDRDTYSKDK